MILLRYAVRKKTTKKTDVTFHLEAGSIMYLLPSVSHVPSATPVTHPDQLPPRLKLKLLAQVLNKHIKSSQFAN